MSQEEPKEYRRNEKPDFIVILKVHVWYVLIWKSTLESEVAEGT